MFSIFFFQVPFLNLKIKIIYLEKKNEFDMRNKRFFLNSGYSKNWAFIINNI